MPTATPDGSAAPMTKLEGLGADMSESEAAEEMLRRFLPKDADKPSKEGDTTKDEGDEPATKDKDKAPADDKDQPEDEPEDEDKGDETDEGDDDDDVVVKIKVDGEEKEATLSRLKRLYGQEAALTKKSMEVAEQRKTVEKELATNTAATQALLQRAKERFEPYSKLDFNLLAAQVGKGELSNEEYTALRQGAQAAYEDVQFLDKNLNGFMDAMRERQQVSVRAQATECLKVLSGPEDKGGIPGWNEKLYDDLRSFAVTQGAPADVVNGIVEPWAFHMLHAAMLHVRGKDKSKIVTVKKNNTPKKIIKTSEKPSNKRIAGQEGDTEKVKSAKARMQSYGSTDDVAEYLLARHNEGKGSED